jgi:hypothetical protein
MSSVRGLPFSIHQDGFRATRGANYHLTNRSRHYPHLRHTLTCENQDQNHGAKKSLFDLV